MSFDGEECYCWHAIRDTALNFLDGLSPQESTDDKKIAFKTARIVTQFLHSEHGKSINYGPEKSIRLHAAIWEKYEISLFKLDNISPN